MKNQSKQTFRLLTHPIGYVGRVTGPIRDGKFQALVGPSLNRLWCSVIFTLTTDEVVWID